eukprot:TRINITY_DN12582_c0_g1_i1.p1 TRINITY_DN12582_c0_g1~~TRINITY_DN12582_c0_g1_i1.p1  ORF type:complete len:511 (-),score=120.91 TRINITY_DN12582_c0_g1_i1:1300-2832(-)
MLAINIPKYGFAMSNNGKKYVCYVLEISFGEEGAERVQWCVYRRYQAFRSLHQQLKLSIQQDPSLAGTKVPPIPGRHMLGNMFNGIASPNFLKTRKRELTEWMNALLQNSVFMQMRIFHDFLRIETNRPPPGIEIVEPTEDDSEEPMDTDATYSAEDDSKKVSIKDFSLIKVIGKGNFGKVFLVHRVDDPGKVYAMKILLKRDVINQNQVIHTMTEREVLSTVDHPFIVKLHWAFQSQKKLFFVLEYCAGGELFYHLGKVGCFSEERCTFYAAELVLALEYLHKKDFVYRDLKPENVLLDETGHVKLTDFGLAKARVTSSVTGATSFCGTVDYLAPEVVQRRGHGHAVDWWSLGALIYEMLSGAPPFMTGHTNDTFVAIQKGQFEMYEEFSAEAKDLLSNLLDVNPTTRLGASGAEEVKMHPFFRTINWEAMLAREISPPWVPDVKHTRDTSHFDRAFTELPVASPDAKNRLGSVDSMGGTFPGFTFVPKPNMSLDGIMGEDQPCNEPEL